MKTSREALRGPLLCLAVALVIAFAAGGCGGKDNDGPVAPLNQEAQKKSMEASGNFYKQKYQAQAKK